MDEPTRRAWSRPELIVIVRSGPEEAVLGGCKYADSYGLGANNNFKMCLSNLTSCDQPCAEATVS